MRRPNNTLSAESVGFRALAYLAAIPDEFQRFLDLSGLDAATIRARAAEPEFLAAVVDFLLSHERQLTGFCESEDMDPRQVHLASRALNGAVAD
jgi:hypothetical protein